MKIGLFFFLLLSFIILQGKKINHAFIPPLELPFRLSGNFGEARKDHFHTGLDIKTNHTINFKVRSIEDGYISRINISPKGYGKALYINHPNGITSVYAHLNKFNSPIDSIVLLEQLTKKRFDIDISLSKNRIKVKKGQVIAFSGNSGSSLAPHLHFETRLTKNQYPINPLSFYPITDYLAPQINSITIYPLSDTSFINGIAKKQTFYLKKVIPNNFKLLSDIKVRGVVGIAVNTYDLQGKEKNKNGVYQLVLKKNNDTIFSYSFNQFGFHHKRYVNALIDYEDYINYKRRSLKCFYPHHINIPIFGKTIKDSGRIVVTKNKENYNLLLSDYNHNTSLCLIKLIKDNKRYKKNNKKHLDSLIKYYAPFKFSNPYVKVSMPSYSTYENSYFNHSTSHKIKNTPFLTHHIGYKTIPIQKYSKFEIKPDKPIVDKLKSKVVVARLDEENKLDIYNVIWEKDFLSIKTRKFGSYAIFIDTLAPVLKALNINENMSKKNSIKITALDDISEIKSYNGFINNKWVVIEYDKKNNLLTHNFVLKQNEELTKYNFKLRVTDRVGNESTLKLNFIR